MPRPPSFLLKINNSGHTLHLSLSLTLFLSLTLSLLVSLTISLSTLSTAAHTLFLCPWEREREHARTLASIKHASTLSVPHSVSQSACVIIILIAFDLWRLFLKANVHWQHFMAKMSVTVTDYLLALATLGDATKNRNDPISVTLPKVAKASSHSLLTLALSWMEIRLNLEGLNPSARLSRRGKDEKVSLVFWIKWL